MLLFKFRTIVAILLVLFGIDEVIAKNSTQERKLTEVKKRIGRVTQSLNSLQLQKNSLLAQLADTEKRYGKITAQLKKLQQESSQIQHLITETKQRINKQKTLIGKHYQGLEGSLRSAYAMGRQERLKLMLNQQDPALTSRVVIYYEYLNRARLEKIQDINTLLDDLSILEQAKKNEAQRLEQNRAEKRIEQASLEKIKKDRKSLLAKLSKDSSAHKAELHQLRKSEKKLKQLLVSLQQAVSDMPFQNGGAKPFHQSRGRIPWPVKGKLVKKFGSKRENSRWDGVLITAREGASVHAVSRGRVVYADWLKGYGLLMIIDHGKGYMTLYAFNQGLLKEVGDRVDTGEIIATVGKSNGRNQAGLYFGIRKKGNPVNPEKWCRKIRNGWAG